MQSLIIAIEAQLIDHTHGGVATHLAALVKALGELDGPEKYILACAEENPDWLRPYMGKNQEVILGPRRYSRRLVKSIFKDNWQKIWGKGYSFAANIFRRVIKNDPVVGRGIDLRGFYEKHGARVVHVFPQLYIHTDLPLIFNPHDLQHEHFPEFFTPEELIKRRYVYKNACKDATVVVAGSQYTKRDVIRWYGIPPEKIHVIPLAPATAAYRSAVRSDEVLSKYSVWQPFILYPAVTWEHKNHLRLLGAIKLLRDKGINVNMVCTGQLIEPHWSRIRRTIEDDGLSDQVNFLGYLPGEELVALYRSCKFVIAPSLFEQASGPMYEAWQEGVAIASSNVTSLPEQAGGAALLFDPESDLSIAGAIEELWFDDVRIRELQEAGKRRLQDFSWEKTAKAYRALYRLLSGYPNSQEDIDLLHRDWMSGMAMESFNSPISK